MKARVEITEMSRLLEEENVGLRANVEKAEGKVEIAADDIKSLEKMVAELGGCW